MYCNLCERKVDPQKAPFSVLWFIVWLPLSGLPYLIYHFFLKPKTRCPICKTNKIEKEGKTQTA